MLNNFLNNLLNNKKTPKKGKNTEGGKNALKPSVEKTVWQINGQDMPIEIHREVRGSWRYSFGKKGLIVRLPHLDKEMERKIFGDMLKSLESRTDAKPDLLNLYEPIYYYNNDILTVGNQTYTLLVEDDDKKSHSARIKANRVIEIRIASDDTEGGKQKAISTLLSRVVSKHQSQEFNRRVLELNHLYFRQNIKSINFKYNHSNWGSCSSSGNLNFSTRLLFAPLDVQNYVIIHELAHLIELNHSDRFWKLVSDAMPDYTEKEKWLKENSALCRF